MEYMSTTLLLGKFAHKNKLSLLPTWFTSRVFSIALSEVTNEDFMLLGDFSIFLDLFLVV